MHLTFDKGTPLQDAEMMEQIDRDVMRTHPDMHFFSGDDSTVITHREVLSSWLWQSCKDLPTKVNFSSVCNSVHYTMIAVHISCFLPEDHH